MNLGGFFVFTAALWACAEATPCAYSPSPLTGLVATAPAGCICKPPCFNSKLALYQKFPLLYKIYAKGCKLFCDKVVGVNPCPPPVFLPPPPKVVACAAPAPVLIPAAPPVTALSPEVLNTLFALNCEPAVPHLTPALGCACT